MSCSSEMEAEPLGILQITYRLLGIDPYDDLPNFIKYQLLSVFTWAAPFPEDTFYVSRPLIAPESARGECLWLLPPT